jgi:hypothetical protein
MTTQRIDYEQKMTTLAARGNYGKPLREGAGCLVCRWWRQPCKSCRRALDDGPRHQAPRKLDLDSLLRIAMSQHLPKEWTGREKRGNVEKPQ